MMFPVTGTEAFKIGVAFIVNICPSIVKLESRENCSIPCA